MKKSLLSFCLSVLLIAFAQAQTSFKTLNYLYSISGSKVVSGQHNDQKDGTTASTYTNRVNAITGKYSALYSADFLFHGNSQMRWDITYEAERQWKAGSMVNILWHACPPNQGNVCGWDGGLLSHLSDAQWNDLITDGGNLNRIWKSRIDEIAVYLQYLEDKGVEVMWRPLHEMNQGSFWWGGRTGANGTKKLYQLTHDYMKNVKGLNNLIWVWDVQDLSTNFGDYNPGNDYFDIAALDIYGDGYTNSSYYNALLTQVGNKPIGIGECFTLPPASTLQNQPRWSFFMNWSYGLQQNNSDQYIREVYNNPRVITLDEMPGWVPVPANLALGKHVKVSSTEAGVNVAANAVDGTYSSRWSSLYSDPQWIYVDLGANYNVNQVKITWEAAYGKDYLVQISVDTINWAIIKTVEGNTSLINDHTGLSGTGRYLRIAGSARGTIYGYSIYELEVYGTPVINQAPAVSLIAPVPNASFAAPASVTISANASDADGSVTKVDFYNSSTLLFSDNTAPYTYTWTNVAAGTYSLTAKATDNNVASTVSIPVSITVTNAVPVNLAAGKPVSVSSTEAGANVAANAVDGSYGTRWSSLYSDPQWIYVDLGASYNINQVKITWEVAYGKDYLVQVASDATNWTTIKTVTGNTSLVNDHTGLSGTGRYLRMTGSERGTIYGYSIYELEVYGNVHYADTFTNDACISIPDYTVNGGYSAGSTVKAGGRKYECKPYPYTGWCNGDSWAYAPGSGLYWSEAWLDKGTCNDQVASPISPMSAELLVPNPATDLVTLTFNQASTVRIFNTHGFEVIPLTKVPANGSINISQLIAGIYYFMIDTGSQVIKKTVIKN